MFLMLAGDCPRCVLTCFSAGELSTNNLQKNIKIDKFSTKNAKKQRKTTKNQQKLVLSLSNGSTTFLPAVAGSPKIPINL